MAVEFQISADHSADVLRELDSKVEAILEAWGIHGVGAVVDIITAESRVDTGAMRNGISHHVDTRDQSVAIGTNIEYAIYHELGTGIYLEGGGGRQTPWSYQDDQGNWHRTRGIKPIHMIKNGVSQSVNDFKSIANDILKR
jgi:hypothetical protein